MTADGMVLQITPAGHTHQWEPLSGWTGRYRCGGCKAIGYRRAEVGPVKYRNTPEIIQPYQCQCKRWAVCKERGKFKCSICRSQR